MGDLEWEICGADVFALEAGWATICAISLPLSGGNTYLQDIYDHVCVGFEGMKSQGSDFPGGPVVRTVHIHCRGVV